MIFLKTKIGGNYASGSSNIFAHLFNIESSFLLVLSIFKERSVYLFGNICPRTVEIISLNGHVSIATVFPKEHVVLPGRTKNYMGAIILSA